METSLHTLIKSYFGKHKNKVQLTTPPDLSFGHLSTNVAMLEAKALKQNPLDLANTIVSSLNKKIDPTVIEKIEVIKPGFINFFFTKGFLIKQAEKVNYQLQFKKDLSRYGRGKTMVIDYSAPNIAKPFGIGHLRSTNIGQAIYNLYQVLGWHCIGDNHLGDWGTQFGKQIVAIQTWWKGDIDSLTIDDLEKLYVKFHQQAQVDKNLEDQARLVFAKLERGDQVIRNLWQKCVDISLVEFNKVYQLIDVDIDMALGESFYQPMLSDIISAFKKKKLAKLSQNALVISFDDMPPAMLVKSDGATSYFTRDMATIKYRYQTWKPDLVIYEVGAEQNLHFKQVFRASELMGWIPQNKLFHVGHGLIRWPTGKFSTRHGDTIHLKDVIDRSIAGATKIVAHSKVTKNLSPTDKKQMIKDVAIGAIKFADLFQHPQKDIIFDWDKVMGLSGDSGPYLQYTYARCLSVLTKSKIKESKNIDVNSLTQPILDIELELLHLFLQFELRILESASTINPSILTQYLTKVAQVYNQFYATTKIIDQKQEVFRLFLTQTTASVLQIGLPLLGIKPIKKM